MIKVTNIQATRIIGVLLILLSSDAFAVRAYATQDGLDTEISNRKSGDSTETARAKVAEGTLKAADTAETARAKVVEGALKAADTTETARATKAEGTLTTAIATETARAKAAESPVLIPGDRYQGGIVFWVDQTGRHGLIAASNDQSAVAQWFNGTYFQTHATGDGIYAGAENTEIIIATQTTVGLVCGESTVPSYCSAGPGTATGNYAALIAANYSVQEDGDQACTGSATETCYGDWYLPSKFELNLMFAQKTVLLDFQNAFKHYWSSTEYDRGSAFCGATTDLQISHCDKSVRFHVRAVRAF